MVLDPSLSSPGGHHFEFATLLRSQLAGTRKLTFYGNAAADPLTSAMLDVRPTFRDFVHPDAHGPFPSLYRAMTQSMTRALASIDVADLQVASIAVSHTTTIFQLGALAQWYSSLDALRRPKLFIQFQHPIDWFVEPLSERPRALALAKEAASVLTRAGSVCFAANSELLTRHIAGALERPCMLMPVPVRWPEGAALREPDSGVVFGFFGGLRREKGALLLAPAIAAFTSSYPRARFIVHAPPYSDRDAVNALGQLPQVELVRRTFVRKADYFALVERARWILLPYDPEPYALRTSGIFIEALGLGIPVVVTPGTWMASELEGRGSRGLIMRDFSAPALANSLEEAGQLMLQTNPAAPRPNRAFITEHSPANFCNAILRSMA
jgi:glycosyltransferase involved in cell wall biosynthesis